MRRVSAPITRPSRTTASRRPPPSSPPTSLDHGLQVHLPTRSMTASNCISNLAQLRPPRLHDYGPQEHLQTRSITASKFTQSWPPSAYLQTHSITASRCMSKLGRSQPPSLSLNSLDYGLEVRPIMASKCIFKVA